MKLALPKNTSQTFGATKSYECKIANGPQAFKLLIDQYSNPQKAIVQEISANCVDAHMRAGKSEVPFKVTMPNHRDDHIRFRDYGNSMSESLIENVYIEFMNSDKRDEEESAGYFGIGSKTPLTYAESFNITTFIDGVATFYVLSFKGYGTPELDAFPSVPTDEPNGTEISFAVKPKDFHLFYEAAKRVFRFHKVKPIIEGYDIKIPEVNITYENKQNDFYFQGKYSDSFVVFGNIAYALNNHSDFNDSVKKCINNGVVAEIPMGSVFMTPSREGLMYNDITVNFLNNHFEKLWNAFIKETSNRVSKCKSGYQALCILQDELKNIYHNDDDYKKISSNCAFDFSLEIDIPNLIYQYEQDSSVGSGSRRNTMGYRYTSRHFRSNNIFVSKDIDKKWDARLRYFASQNGNKNVYLTDSSEQELLQATYSIKEDGVVLKASELPDAPKIKNQKSKDKNVKSVFRYDSSGRARRRGLYASRHWQPVDIDITKNQVIYVNINRYNPDINMSVLDAFTSVFNFTPIVIGLNSENFDLSERKNFIHLKDYLKDYVAKNIPSKIEDLIYLNNIINDFSHRDKYHELASDVNKITNDIKDLVLYVNKLRKEIRDNFQKIESWLTICRILKYNPKEHAGTKKESEKFLKMDKEFYTRFPMLLYVNDRFMNKPTVIDYINER